MFLDNSDVIITCIDYCAGLASVMSGLMQYVHIHFCFSLWFWELYILEITRLV